MRGLVIGVSLVVILAIVAFLFVNNKNNDTTTKKISETSATTPTTSDQDSTGVSDTTMASNIVIITYSNNGFSPSTVKVTSGGSVTVKNDSNRTLQFDSNPHPAHTDNTELNLGVVQTGESKSFTVTKKGTWEYHNHLSASDEGAITVE